MTNFYIKQDDTSPSIQGTLERPDGTAVNLTSATVRFHMQKGNTTLDAAATIVTPATGIVRYDWQAGDTDVIGTFNAEWEVTYADASIETFPNSAFQKVVVTADLA